MNVKDALSQAYNAVVEADLPTEFRLVAFEKAFDHITGRRVHHDVPNPIPAQNGYRDGSRDSGASDSLELLARKLGIDLDTVERVFSDDGTGLRLTVPPRLLPRNNKSAATQNIALLVAASKQASAGEEWTPTSAIRSVVEEYGQLDPKNFAAHIKDLTGQVLPSPKGQERAIKLGRRGWETVTELVRSYGGDVS